MTAHTPGPWHWEADQVKNDPLGRIRYQVTTIGKTITRVYYSSFEGGPTNAEANARLIAAAPELLRSLKWAMVHLQEVGGEDCPDYVDARAAIAKAEGA